MPNLSALSRGTQLLAGAGVLLLLVTFLKWQSVDVGPFTVGQNAWNGFWGVVMGLALIVLLAWVVARIFDVTLPFELPEDLVTLGLAALVFVTALLKNLTDDYSTIWSYLGVLLAAGVVAGAWLRYQESGGTIDSLRSSVPARTRETPAPAAPPASTAPAEPPAATMPDTPSETPAAPPAPAEPASEPEERPRETPPSATDQT